MNLFELLQTLFERGALCIHRWDSERAFHFYPANGTVNDLIRDEYLTTYTAVDSRHYIVFRGGRTGGIMQLKIENGFAIQVIDRDW